METTKLVHATYTYNKVELTNRIILIINGNGGIKEWCENNDYRLDSLGFKIDLSKNDQLSKNQLKKINKYIIGLEKKLTMRKINSFFHLLTKTCGCEWTRVKYSEKEEKIQKARKEMLKAKESYENLLSIYKTEKGDYYKS